MSKEEKFEELKILAALLGYKEIEFTQYGSVTFYKNNNRCVYTLRQFDNLLTKEIYVINSRTTRVH